MTPAADTDLRCHHCNAAPTMKEMADGWCDSCGKRLPDACAAEAKRVRATATPAPRSRSRPRVLWGVVILVVAAVAAVALAG